MKEAKYACRLLQGRLSVLFIVALLGFGTLWAQNKTVTGLVKDDKGESIIGASVMVKGTKIATITNIDGKYRISVPADAKTLVITYVGMEKKEVQINGTTINVVLQASDKTLDEVVVVGYGTIKKKDLTGSVGTVSDKQLKDIPVTTAAEALTGKLTGVQVTTTEGSPDADIKIRVRGGGSITQSNSPLYIVDGFLKDDIKDISPSEIQDISVLKDASSTAIYGSRGANGVIIVTTKSAEQGKISVSINSYLGMKKVARTLSVLTPYQFAQKQYERAVWNGKVSSEYENYFGSYDDINLYSYMAGTNWQSKTFGNTGVTDNISASVGGGNKKFSYNGTYSHAYEKAIMYMSDYRRDNIGVKLNYSPAKWIKLDLSARYSNTKIDGSGANDQTGLEKSTSDSRVKNAVVYTPIPLKNLAAQDDDVESTSNLYSPLTTTEDNNRLQKNYDANVNFGVSFIFNKYLSFRSTIGYTDIYKDDNRFYGLSSYYVINGGSTKRDNQYAPAVFLTDTYGKKYQNTNLLTFKKDNLFRDQNINFVLGQESYISTIDYIKQAIEALPQSYDSFTAWDNLGEGTMVSNKHTYDPDYRKFSYFSRLNYDIKDRYLFAFSARADGSSKFLKNRWGYFPSASFGWRVTEERFMKSSESWLSNLKLRGGYGAAGMDDIPSSMFMRAYSSSYSGFLPANLTTTIYSAGITLANPDLKWETTYTTNGGIDFGFFKNRISGSVELYSNKTKDALINLAISGPYSSIWMNAASTQNQGAELNINALLIKSKDFNLNFAFNISTNRNKVISLGSLSSYQFNEGWTSYTSASNSYLVTPGQPVGLIYGYVSEGMYSASDFSWSGTKWVMNSAKYSTAIETGTDASGNKTYKYADANGNVFVDNSSLAGASWGPGAMKLKDVNGDGKITESDKTKIGNTNPKHYGSFSFTADYKGFDASVNFNWVYGNNIYNANKIELSSAYYKYRNMLAVTANSYTQIDWATGQRVTDTEKLDAMNANATMWASPTGQYATTSWAIEDGSFLRLNNLTLGYTLPSKLTKKAGIQKVRFYAAGYNLWIWTNYSGYDPEVDTRRSTPATPGVDYSAYPKSRSYNVGVNINF